MDRIARELEDAREIMRSVQLETKLNGIVIDQAREMLRESRELLERLTREGKFLPPASD